jgi:hypothetical protein
MFELFRRVAGCHVDVCKAFFVQRFGDIFAFDSIAEFRVDINRRRLVVSALLS